MPSTRLGHVAIRCSDLDASLAFYAKLGLREAFRMERPDGGGVALVYITGDGISLVELFPGGTERVEAGRSRIGLVHLCLVVDDVHATYREALAAGVPATGEPRRGPNGAWSFRAIDPDGASVEIMQITPDSRHAAAEAAWRREHAPSRSQVSALPTVPLAPSSFEPSGETTLTWLSASGFLINARGTLVMLDPLLTYHPQRPGAGETGHRLLVRLPIQASEVPRLDAVCYSHSDGDHFGRRTAEALARTGALFVGPPPVARGFEALGIPAGRQRVARIGQGFRLGAVDITPIRADHPWQLNQPARVEPPFGPDDCCGYLIRTPDGTIFFPGDTRLVWDHYQLQDVDVLLLDPGNCPYHLGVENAARLANKLGSPHVIPYHYGTFDAPNSIPQNGDPADLSVRLDDPSHLHVLPPGEPFRLTG